MFKNRKQQFKLLTGLAVLLCVPLMFFAGCDTNGEDKTSYPPPTKAELPGQVVFGDTQHGYEILNLEQWASRTVAQNNLEANDNNKSGVVFIWWPLVDGATEYDVYVIDNPPSTPLEPPATPAATVNRPYYAIKGCEQGRMYFFWVQVKNSNGAGPISARGSRNFGENKRTPEDRNTYGGADFYPGAALRADWPRTFLAYAGDGKVDLTWTRSDRAAWYEVYYATTNLPDASVPANTVTGSGYFGQSWNESSTYRLVPYCSLKDTSGEDYELPFLQTAVPWTGTGAGTPGTASKLYSLSETITGLTNGQEYYFWVRSLNATGERGYNRVGPITPGPATMSAPTGVKTKSGKFIGSFDVSWSPVAGATGYKIFYSQFDATPLPNSPLNKVVEGGTVSTVEVSTLFSNYQYYVWVAAMKDGVAGALSAPVGVVTKPGVVGSDWGEREPIWQ